MVVSSKEKKKLIHEELPPVSKRFYDFVLSVSGNEYEFSKSIGMDRADGIYKITRHGGAPGDIILTRVIERYPNLNINWLFSGVPPMLLSELGSVSEKSISIAQFKNLLQEITNAQNTLTAIRDKVVAMMNINLSEYAPISSNESQKEKETGIEHLDTLGKNVPRSKQHLKKAKTGTI